MIDGPRESLSTYTRERVKSIYQDGLEWKKTNSIGQPRTFHARAIDHDATSDLFYIFTAARQKERLREMSRSYFHAVREPQDHVAQLDQKIAALIDCCYDGILDEDYMVSKACALLSRMPATPPLTQALIAMFRGSKFNWLYFEGVHDSHVPLDRDTWDKLLVTRWFDTNTIKIALTIVQVHDAKNSILVDLFGEYLITLAEISESTFSLLYHCNDAVEQQSWLLASSFLWTCWYRGLMLYLHSALHFHLQLGYDVQKLYRLNMRHPLPQMGLHWLPLKPSQYLCPWAFELLRSDRASVSQDFRRFHQRFSALHGQRPARCLGGPCRPCSGQGPTYCQRFTGLKIVDQSAHDASCDGQCQSLLWDETSYRSVSGARAVSITDSDGGYIRYCRASPQTIAVSHVWAHGAGGRPHTGFNDCLHQRLVRIARENNCDSYWMDTPCIPEDHQLRAEAITYINEVFHTSSMTLVWDRDLMAIDISHASIETQEAILCTLLVCDWALRSWTLLESMRARHNIHLLCKDNKTIALRDCLLNVHHDGAIDIATLLLTSQQLLPTAKYDVESPDEEILKQMEGYVPVEEALHLLARRHASRPGDSIVILSLLIDDKPVYTAEAFWKSKIGYSLSTGVLFSSQPRLRCKGFRWAPSQPELPLAVSNRVSPYSQEHLFDGSRTTIAIITPDGLDGRFATFEIPELGQEPRENTALTSLIQKLPWLGHRGREPVQARILRGHFQLGKYQHSMLLLPVHDNTSRGALFHAYRGRSNGLVFAVVGSNDEDRRTWQWLGTFEWDLNSPPHPKVRKEREKIFIV
ncbi:uncharacterized protein Z520_10181 [Fonsecaea multimorphosa CBS 102226]|uniref:Heterokaryon incompatibility domain-containing protein n=1 Tax=Fonsecaea multimorphosa CBS 102226 TaxID=1442371 RepID=A0A0D2GX31_9EURO|nr:uncharacterized protein Z520_10181 [Fonsecaea multimorphosa CBS 102226]KIX94155.1 hypothetical protein Z520_10181 [Fonsecaea multimorphosa CBS 102226]